jgi:hypothetical protein
MKTKTIQIDDRRIGLSLKPKQKVKTKNTSCVRPNYKHIFYCNEINKQKPKEQTRL